MAGRAARVALGGVLAAMLPARLAGWAAARWLERLQREGTRNAALAVAAFEAEAAELEALGARFPARTG